MRIEDRKIIRMWGICSRCGGEFDRFVKIRGELVCLGCEAKLRKEKKDDSSQLRTEV